MLSKPMPVYDNPTLDLAGVEKVLQETTKARSAKNIGQTLQIGTGIPVGIEPDSADTSSRKGHFDANLGIYLDGRTMRESETAK